MQQFLVLTFTFAFFCLRRYSNSVMSTLADRLAEGRAKVVWAGVGRKEAGVDDFQMAAIRDKVAHARAERLQLQKLESIKPYSWHA